MRKIKIDNKVYEFDCSDGRDNISFGCNGVGGMKIYIDNNLIDDNCFVAGTNKMLDGNVNFTLNKEIHNGSYYFRYILDDKNYNELRKIHNLDYQDIQNININKRLEIITWGLKYEEIEYIESGYRFGRELTYNDFCVCFDSKKIIIFKASHNGFIAPDYIILENKYKNFNKIYNLIIQNIKEYFDIKD